MGIRLDQLHSEVFEKINNDLNNASAAFSDYLEAKIAEIDVVFGLPETTHIERDIEVNKRNLEKSGFIEINRNFVPFRNGEQADTGVWISNLDENESPFEPQTIDGQKRGINVAGYNINYTKGDIGQDISKMMQLPIAPNLPVFFPEDNDMILNFQPKKTVINEKVITDSAITITVTNRITDEYKIDIDQMIDGDVVKYYYMDEDSNVFYLRADGTSYIETDPDADPLVEPYTRYSIDFGNTFQFERIYNSEAVAQYIDSDTSRIFDIVPSVSNDATEVRLQHNDSDVFLDTMTVTRFVEENGVLVESEITQPMLVTYNITTQTINGLDTEILNKVIVSEQGFKVQTDNNGNEYIEDKNIRMYLNTGKKYFYYPYSKQLNDETYASGDFVWLYEDGTLRTDADGNYIPATAGAPKIVVDTSYVKYIDVADITDTNGNIATTITVQDNLDDYDVKDIHTIDTTEINYYRVDALMVGDGGNIVSTLDTDGNYTSTDVNANRAVKITTENILITTLNSEIYTHSAGKVFYYYHEVGTKYYKKSNGDIYFIDSKGDLYTPSNDVQEIFEGTLDNSDTYEHSDIMIYVANNLTFYIDSESLRTYILDESKQEIQLTDVNGYRVFEKKTDSTKVYVYVDSEDNLKMVTISEDGTETPITISYNEIMPVFETEEVLEDVLNLVIPVDFNIIQGNIKLTRNGQLLSIYSDYEIDGLLSLDKPLEFNEEINKGDTLYIKRVGKKDIILRLEKTGTPTNDIDGHWANDNGIIVMPEPLTGNSFNWTDGQELLPSEQLDYNDIVKKDNKYFQYLGSALSYEDMPVDDKTVTVVEGGVFWEDVTVQELEYERKGQNYKIFNADKNDIIRFTIIRRVWEQDSISGELTVVEKDPYTIEKIAAQDGENLFILDDQNFFIDDNASLESYILTLEKITYFGEYTGNRANDFTLRLTGLQTVAVNEDPAMIYGEGYFLSKNILTLLSGSMTDVMVLKRIQAPQAELKIDFITEEPQPKVTVPFDIIKNKFDIVVPQVIEGHEYTWIMGETLPEGKALKNGDVVFDKENLKFYKFIGQTKVDSLGNPILKRSLLRESDDLQKELLRQYLEIESDLTGNWFSNFDIEWAKNAEQLSSEDNLSLEYFVVDSNGNNVLNLDDAKVVSYLQKAKETMVNEMVNDLNEESINNMTDTDILTPSEKQKVIEILSTDLDQFVLKLIKYGGDGNPLLDEDGNIVYYYKYTRTFMVEENDDGFFIVRNINGVETELQNTWENITVPKVGYYRFGKTFTILDTKDRDQVVVRLLSTGAEEFTSKRVVSEGGEITFAIDFNIEEDDGTEIPFEVIYEEINWVEGLDYIQEGQDLTLTMLEEIGQEVTIRRNDEFDLIDIVVLERKDLVFIEVWHEAVDETDFIFPFGNVQYQGSTSDNIDTVIFDHTFYDTVNGETAAIPDGAKQYCQAFQKSNIVYNYYDGTEFDSVTDEEKKLIDETFVEDNTIGRGWKLSELSDEDRKTIFHNADHNLYFDGDKLVQIRYRTRIVGLNLFNNFFRGTSPYMSEGLRFQGKSPVTSRIVTQEVGEDATGQPITETLQIFAGGTLIQASNPNSLLYKEGKLFDDALFTVEEPTDLSHNNYVYAIPVAIVNRRNQGVYHPEFNDNGTSFFINGIHVSEDIEDFADDISGFTLVDENAATLETSSVGRDRKAKFKVMLKWLFSADYKAGGSMVSRTTYRPDGLLYDEINTRDIFDLRIDANDQRKRIEDLEADVKKGFNDLDEFSVATDLRFDQTTSYINTTANLIYDNIAKVEASVRKDMEAKDEELTQSLETTNINLADLSANVFTKDISTSLLIDTILGLTDYNTTDAFTSGTRPTRDEITGMVNSFVENMEGPYTKAEFMKFLVTVLKSIVSETMLDDETLDRWIRRLSVKDLSLDADTEIYSRAESLELIYEGLVLASSARILPPVGSDKLENWAFKGTRFDGWLGTRHLDLKKDFIENGRTPLAEKEVKVVDFTKTYTDRLGKVWNKGYIAGPTVWGNVHNYHAIYTTWIFVEKPFKLDYVKMNGDDPHAIYINEEKIASNKYCCRDTAYSYDFAVAGWYRIDAMYSERYGGHAVQLGWNPKDYTDNIKYVTTTNMDEAVRVTKLRLDNWASKMKSLISTIKGDASGYFTKLEIKLILIEGLQRITHNILENGTNVTDDMLRLFHTGDSTNIGLEAWIDNINPSDPGTFSALGYEVQDGTDEFGNTYPRADEFRPIPDLTGNYNKVEIIEIIRKSLQLANGIDSINSDDIQKWFDRLNISIDMPDGVRYYTKTQINTLIKDGSNYLAGMDSATSYEISAWLDNHISNIGEGITDVNYVFTDANGNDLSVTDATQTYSKTEANTLLATETKKILGAQSARTR